MQIWCRTPLHCPDLSCIRFNVYDWNKIFGGYNFNKVAQYNQLTSEEAQEKMKNRRRNAEGFQRWLMKVANTGAASFGEVEKLEGGGRHKKGDDDADDVVLSDKGEEDEGEEERRKSRLGLNKRDSDNNEQGVRGGDLDVDDHDIEKGPSQTKPSDSHAANDKLISVFLPRPNNDNPYETLSQFLQNMGPMAQALLDISNVVGNLDVLVWQSQIQMILDEADRVQKFVQEGCHLEFVRVFSSQGWPGRSTPEMFEQWMPIRTSNAITSLVHNVLETLHTIEHTFRYQYLMLQSTMCEQRQLKNEKDNANLEIVDLRSQIEDQHGCFQRQLIQQTQLTQAQTRKVAAYEQEVTLMKGRLEEAMHMVKCSRACEHVAKKHLKQRTTEVYALRAELQQLKLERAASLKSRSFGALVPPMDDGISLSVVLSPMQNDTSNGEPLDPTLTREKAPASACNITVAMESANLKRKSGDEFVKPSGLGSTKKARTEGSKSTIAIAATAKDERTPPSKTVSPSGKRAVPASNKTTGVQTKGPLTEEEIRTALQQMNPVTTQDLVSKFKHRLTVPEDKLAFSSILKKISRIHKTNGGNFVVLR